MTFGQFIHILYNAIGGEKNIPDFAIHFIDKISAKPSSDADNKKAEDGEYNPLANIQDKNAETLRKYCAEKVDLPKRKKQEIRNILSEDNFVNYFTTLNDKQFENIKKNFEKNGINFDPDVGDVDQCYALFCKILDGDLSTDNNNTLSENTANKSVQNLPDNEQGISKLRISEKCHLCLYCKNWKGDFADSCHSSNGTYGRCVVFSKNTLSTEGTSCDRYDANVARVTIYDLQHPQLK